MIETGVVIETRQDQATVAFAMNEACRTCKAGCLLMSSENGRRVLQAHNPVHAQVGDSVHVKISPVSSAGSAAILFLFPLLGMIVGYVVGQALTGTQAGGMAGTGIALLLAFIGVRFLDRMLSRRRGYEPVILSRAEEERQTGLDLGPSE